VQFEIAGPGVQGNPMGLEYLQGFAFNLFRLDGGRIEAEFPPYAWNFMPQAEGILAPRSGPRTIFAHSRAALTQMASQPRACV
jgi:hypothetical protein